MPPTPPLALVPVRDPGRGKSRLAGTLRQDARAALTSAMLADVVAALSGAGIDRIVVLAAGPVAAASARALGVDVLRDPPGGHGLNAAIAAASRRIRADASLVVPADLPLLTSQDVTALVQTAGEVVVAPTHDGGTGGLLRRPAWAIDPVYGGRSAARHLLAARRAGLTADRIELPGFAADVDGPDDLRAIAGSAQLGTVTSLVLRDIGVRSA
jgi:2-phospho-L-lactate guanylyltransferase